MAKQHFFFSLAHLKAINEFLPFLNIAVNEYLVKAVSGAWKAVPGASCFTARQGFTDWLEQISTGCNGS